MKTAVYRSQPLTTKINLYVHRKGGLQGHLFPTTFSKLPETQPLNKTELTKKGGGGFISSTCFFMWVFNLFFAINGTLYLNFAFKIAKSGISKCHN